MRKLFLILLCAGLLFGGYKLFSSSLFNSKDHFNKHAVGEKITVRFTYPDLAMEEFSDREKGDQARDWMLYTLLSNSGLNRKEFAETIFDMPPVRYGFNNSLGNFEFGETRSKFIGKGQVIALVPTSDDKKRTDNLGHILDEIRKNQGEIPQKVYVFEYDLNIEGKFAHIKRLENIDAATFFTEASGYYESPVKSLDDLKAFMDKIDDVTYAKRESGSIILGGRHLFAQTYGKATVEDIAAIWQSEKNIMDGQAQKETRATELKNTLTEKINTVIEQYNKELQELSFSDGSTFTDLSDAEQRRIANYVQSTVFGEKDDLNDALISTSLKTDASLVTLIAKMKKATLAVKYEYAEALSEFKENAASASGFSLDPAVNFEESIAFVNRYSYLFEEALSPQFTVDQVIDQLNHKQGDLFQYAVANAAKLEGGEELEREARERCIYQKARYDGSLEGTQVGMTLFYTDLMAKIWTINSLHSKPTDFVSGFKDDEQSYMLATRVFKEEAHELSAVRLWFGPNKNGFQCNQSTAEISFARNATQIFALSNDPGSAENISEEGENKNLEQQASAEFDVALSWWNNHFEEVAAFEHQYERLNEIMKWSTIIGWINSSYYLESSLDFLAAYPVNHDSWFPDWARAQKDLKFNDWGNIPFHTRGYLNNKTEAIPILYSPNMIISGGVSLAEKSLLKEAPEILTADKALFRRANIVQDVMTENAFLAHNETRLVLRENVQAKSFNINVSAKEGYKLRNRFGEVENTQFKWDLIEEPNGTFTFSSKMGDVPIGELHYSQTAQNAFTVGFESRAVDKGMSIAKQASDYSGDVKDLLANHPQVEKYLILENGDCCVKMKNSEEWMVMRVHPELTKASVNLEAGWQARTSGNRLYSKNIDLKWVNELEVVNLNKGAPIPSSKNTVDLLDESPAGLRQKILETKGKQEVDAELVKIKNTNISEAERLAGINEFEKASARIEKVILHFGETPQLTALRVNYELRAGLKAWEKGNLSTAVNHLNDAITIQPLAANRSDIFKEVDRLINSSEISPFTKEKIIEMAKLYKTDEQMIVSGIWEGYLPLAKQVPLDNAASAKGAKIIYEDNAAFSNIDPSLPFETVIGEIRSIPGVQAFDISAEAIGKNTRMYASLEPRLVLGIPVQQLKFRVHPGSAVNNCIDRDNDGKCDDSYTVPGPVYYVKTASRN